jgi:hypothetical protein
MTERSYKSLDAARQRIQQEIDCAEAEIASLEQQLSKADADISRIVSQSEDTSALEVAERRKEFERNPRNIAAEDALDTIVRLENTLKVVQRRNVLLSRENALQKKLHKDRIKVLEQRTKECDELVRVTGFHDRYVAPPVEESRQKVEEMISLEATLNKELASAFVIIRKKEQLVETLQLELDKKVEKEEQLQLLYNDIRVKDRDCQEIQAQIDEIKREDRKKDSALVLAETRRGITSINSIRGDMDFLRNEIEKQKAVRRRQEEIIKAELQRARELQARLDVVQAALHDCKQDKEFEKMNAKSSMIVVASVEDPEETISQIIPEDEQIPIETYLLLHRNNELMRTSVSRKDMMVLEKEATIQALEAKLETQHHSYTVRSQQQFSTKAGKAIEMSDLQETVTAQHHEYRKEIENLLAANLKLKMKLLKTPPPSKELPKMKY